MGPQFPPYFRFFPRWPLPYSPLPLGLSPPLSSFSPTSSLSSFVSHNLNTNTSR